MRFVSKGLALAMGLLTVGVLSSGVRADDVMVGSFKLPHTTSWRGMTLPAGDYEFKLARTQSDARMLTVQGSKQTLAVLVFAQDTCQTCRKSELTLDVNGESRVVSSLELPGYHVDFKRSWTKMEREQQARKSPASPEQVAVQVNSN
jgi:hypothetical protein